MPYDPELLRLAADITAAHVSHSTVTVDALPNLFRSVYVALSTASIERPAAQKPKPAVPIRKSVFADHIVCLEDGRKMKLLKRHLLTAYGLTPDTYRERWDLPADYPMTAPNYAAALSALAKQKGLGRKPTALEGPSSPLIQQTPRSVRGKRVV